ncbi:MAG: MFS transporter [Deltaproteobacteria bacterium]|nr:MFS transporter [Deltaproteobacteria bacterium]
MMKSIKGVLKGSEKDFLIFLISGVFLGIAQSVDGSTLTNYLKEHFGMMILQRSALEFPRELPGLLVMIVIGAMSFLGGDVRISVAANLLAGIGMFFLGIIPPHYTMVIFSIFIYSMGQHIFMPLSGSIAMSFATPGEMGRVLGRLSSVGNMAIVVSSASLYALYEFAHISFRTAFTIGAVSFVISAILLGLIKPTQTVHVTKRYVFRKEYRLYYWLCMLYGARKQIFITFGPWVLVEVFKQPVAKMTLLFFIVAVIGIFVKPWVGHMIDRVGERIVLSTEAFLFFLTCLGYAFAENLFPPTVAVFFIYICYIVDITLDSVYMARITYMKKIALIPEDISPSLSFGTSIDHVVTIFLPMLGGLAWSSGGVGGYKYVFLGGAVVAFLNFVSSRRINTDRPAATI